MPKKRGNGEGSISQRPDGRWQGQICLGRNDNGKLKRLTFYGKTRKEVADKLKTALADYQRGVFIEPSKTTFETYLINWLKSKKISVSKNTYSKYETLSRNHLKDRFGDIELQKITRLDIQSFIAEKSETHSAKTIAEIHMLLKNILELAVQDHIILRNPCYKIELPKIIPPQIRILNKEELTHILTACSGTRIYNVVFLELSTGLRRGEILGLKWKDIDFYCNTIAVNKSWVLINGIPQWSDNETKTEAGKRTIAIPEQVTVFLKTVYAKNPKTQYVFQSRNGLPLNPNNFLRDYKKYIEKAEETLNKSHLQQDSEPIKLDISFHDLRHNYGTKLAALNIHQRIIETQMGHKDYRSSRRYIHATQEAQHYAAQKIGEDLSDIHTATGLQ